MIIDKVSLTRKKKKNEGYKEKIESISWKPNQTKPKNGTKNETIENLYSIQPLELEKYPTKEKHVLKWT